MNLSSVKLVLLPGMDGTGDLFTDFRNALPQSMEPMVVRFPRDRFLDYPDLLALLQAGTLPSGPYVLLAESFSTPLAIQFAATNPPNLKALVLCAGFATSPLRGFPKIAARWLAPILFAVPPPAIAIKALLLGSTTTSTLLFQVKAAIESVAPKVLSSRLRAVLDCDVRAVLSKTVLPILYMQAEQDRLVSARSMKEIQELRPDIVNIAINGPHLLLQSNPQEAAQAITHFLQQISHDGATP